MNTQSHQEKEIIEQFSELARQVLRIVPLRRRGLRDTPELVLAEAVRAGAEMFERKRRLPPYDSRPGSRQAVPAHAGNLPSI